MSPLISVVVLNWNRRDDLLDALQSVRRQSYPRIEMIVVDNCSSDGSVVAAAQAFPEATIIELDKNYGCPGGRNRGVAHVKGEFVFFLDNDGVLDDDAVAHAYEAIGSDARIAVVTGKTVDKRTGKERCLFGAETQTRTDGLYVSDFNGGASLHRLRVFRELGGYPDDYVYGGEETHLALRLIDKGYRIWYEPRVIMYHKLTPAARGQIDWQLRRVANSLTTAVQLLPPELAAFSVLRACLLEPGAAVAAGYLGDFVRAGPGIIRRVIRAASKRGDPITRSAFAMRLALRRGRFDSPEEIERLAPSYLSELAQAAIGRTRNMSKLLGQHEVAP